jgi:PhzF family phenazine biosynthesis protein
MRSRLPLFHVDAFTERPFSGNPAAVCILDADREDTWFQAVAAEMNLPETAFLRRDGKGWRLRWFTPTIEMDLCGHATLASAHVLWEEGHAASGDVLSFETKSGELQAVKRGDDIELDFPAEPASPVDPPSGLLEALGIRAPRAVAANRMDYLVVLDSESLLRAVRPAFGPLAAACRGKRGVIVTAPSEDARFDFVSRFFAPAAGIDEDPVTGSAHCCLAPYWAGRLQKAALVGYQASPRGGVVSVRVEGRRVALGGKAVTVFAGQLAGV